MHMPPRTHTRNIIPCPRARTHYTHAHTHTLTEPPALKYSHFASSSHLRPYSSESLLQRTMGVLPMHSSTESEILRPDGLRGCECARGRVVVSGEVFSVRESGNVHAVPSQQGRVVDLANASASSPYHLTLVLSHMGYTIASSQRRA